MKKLTWDEFIEIMKSANKDKNQISGVIVFKPESFEKEFTEEERSYRVKSNSKYFNSGAISKSLFGNSLDGSDTNVRLDWYMQALPEDNLGKRWKVDYCYIEDEINKDKVLESIEDDVRFKEYVRTLLRDGAIDDPDYVNKLSDEEFEDLLTNTWMKDQEIIDTYKSLNESQVKDAADTINNNDWYNNDKRKQTFEGMLADKIAEIAEELGDDYSEWLSENDIEYIIGTIKVSSVWTDFEKKLDKLIREHVEDRVDWIRRDEPASKYYDEENLEESKKTGENSNNTIENTINKYFDENGFYMDEFDSSQMTDMYTNILDLLNIIYSTINTESISDGKYKTIVEINNEEYRIDTKAYRGKEEVINNVKDLLNEINKEVKTESFEHINDVWEYLEQSKNEEDLEERINNIPRKFGLFTYELINDDKGARVLNQYEEYEDYQEDEVDIDFLDFLDESLNIKNEDYTQASNVGAIKVDIMGKPKKKTKKDKEDPALKSLPVQQVLIEEKEYSSEDEIYNDLNNLNDDE